MTKDTVKPDNASENQAQETGITLESPIKRGGDEIKHIALRKPTAGHLRGLSLLNIMQLDVDSLTKVLPRVSTPAITEAEAKRIDPVDLISLGTELLGFFTKAESQETA